MASTSRIDLPPADTRATQADAASIEIDPFRMYSFPNALRERRVASGYPTLLALSEQVPEIPYIRLSKIERGEVFARAEELCRIAYALGLDDPGSLLVDPDEPDFSMNKWVGSRTNGYLLNREAEELAMLLGAALRRLRTSQPTLTLARLQEEHCLPAVIVSRIENAAKPFDRWNTDTIGALAGLFGVTDRDALITLLRHHHCNGTLTEWLARIPGAAAREERTRERLAALRTELERVEAWDKVAGPAKPLSNAHGGALYASSRSSRLQVVGVPLGDGLIEPFPNPQMIAAPHGAGPNVYALRMCRASLGATIPGNAVLIVDPDRAPVQGGLAVLKESDGLRVLALSTDKYGRLIGHSSNPEMDVVLDGVAPGDLAGVTAVIFP